MQPQRRPATQKYDGQCRTSAIMPTFMPQCIIAKKKEDYIEVFQAGKRLSRSVCVSVSLGLLGGFLNGAQGAIWARGGARE